MLFSNIIQLQQYLPFTVLKQFLNPQLEHNWLELQQYLPFTVLKLSLYENKTSKIKTQLQQYLPFTVLKLKSANNIAFCSFKSCNSTYRLRY